MLLGSSKASNRIFSGTDPASSDGGHMIGGVPSTIGFRHHVREKPKLSMFLPGWKEGTTRNQW